MEEDVAKDSSDIHSSHCDTCINVTNCEKLRTLSKSRPDEFQINCPVTYCKFSCGHRFHHCKKDEHELLCPKVKVPCINQEYGCPLILERGRRGIHLETCPASVVVCTMEWNRWPLPSGKCQPFTFDPSQPDVASTLRDQKTILEWKECIPSTLRYLLRTYVNERHPVMPLGVSGLRIPKSIINQTMLEHSLKAENDISESTESDHDESSDSPWGWKNSPPGLQESVCNKLKSFKVSNELDKEVKQNEIINGISDSQDEEDEFHSCASSDDSIQEHNNEELESELIAREQVENILNEDQDSNKLKEENGANKQKTVDLSLMVEVRTRCQRKPDSMYTFMCSKEFRRDEFPVHFYQIHSGIHSQLNGWLYMRCPLANEGCAFGLERMHPCDDNYRVIYNQTADAFCFTQNMNNYFANAGSCKAIDKTEEDTVLLSSLPFELLVHLTKYLDPLSLNALSMTSQIFRDVCTCVIVDRGIVVSQWEKKETIGWEISEKKWIFSQSFSPIRKWAFSDVGRMITHMKDCLFFDRNEHTKKPFSYPIRQDQL